MITYEEGKKLADKYNLPFFETSAKDNINIDEAFYALYKAMYQRLLENEQKKSQQGPQKQIQPKKKKQGCVQF